MNHYRRLARELAPGGPVLELGCGSGRVTCALARDGQRVVGVDLAPAMLARAAARIEALPRLARARVELHQGDMRTLALRKRFPLVICPFNTFQHLYVRRDIAAALERIVAHVAGDGRFALDVLHPDLRWLARDPTRRFARTRFTHPESGRRYEYSTSQRYDEVAQIVYVRLFYKPLDPPLDGDDTVEKVVRLAHRVFFPAELAALLAHAGLRVEERWGGFAGEPYDGDSPSQVLVCRRA